MGPDGLDGLSVGHPNPIHIGKVEVCLARCSMSNDVELGNCNAEVEGVHVERSCGRVVCEALSDVFPPLTANIVGDDDIRNPGLNIIREG